MTVYTKFRDIPQFTKTPHYHVDCDWEFLFDSLNRYGEMGLNLDPDFQRAHVWTEAQQVAYVEYVLRGGRSGREVYLNHPFWMHFREPKAGQYRDFVLVDGKQRINAVSRFLRDEIPAFGTRYSGYGDKLRMTGPSFSININDLKTKKEVLTWYLEMNSGGTPHTQEELDKVRAMLGTG